MHDIVHVAYACDLLQLCGISRRNSFKGGKNVKPEKILHFLKKGKMVISTKNLEFL